jgi:hypothetical protein
MKTALALVLAALPALAAAHEEDHSAMSQLCRSSGEEECAPIRIPDSVGRARPIVRAAPAPQPQTTGSGRVTGSGYFDPMEGGRGGVGVVHVIGDISVSRPDGARGLIRVRGVVSVPDDAVDGATVRVHLTGSGAVTLDGRPAGRETVELDPSVSLIVSGTYVRVDQVVSFGPVHEPFNCESDNAPSRPERVP